VLPRVVVCCSVLQCGAVCCSVLQCVAVCCSELQCVADSCDEYDKVNVTDRHTGSVISTGAACVRCRVHCNRPQHSATHFNVLQCCVSWLYSKSLKTMPQERWVNSLPNSMRTNTLQHTATHCNTLQHTTTHCNTLQHITVEFAAGAPGKPAAELYAHQLEVQAHDRGSALLQVLVCFLKLVWIFLWM